MFSIEQRLIRYTLCVRIRVLNSFIATAAPRLFALITHYPKCKQLPGIPKKDIQYAQFLVDSHEWIARIT
jgi:hypothetical protein